VKEDFLEPVLRGERFNAHSVPLEILKDFSALQEMLVEVAKWKYHVANPTRERVPRNFTEGLELHLESVEPGSAKLRIALVFAGLFAAGNNSVHFEEARAEIVNAIAAAQYGRAPTMPANLLSYFDRFGRGLREGDSLVFVEGEREAVLTPEVRKQLIRSAQVGERTDEVSIRARIPEVDQKKNTFEFELRDGSRIKANLGESYRQTVLTAFNSYVEKSFVLVQGVAKMDREDRPRIFESIEHVTLLDPQDVTLRLEELSMLDDGWLDGEGVALHREKLLRLAGMFDRNFDSELPLPYLYPTPEGRIRAEWSLGTWETTLDLDIDGFEGTFQVVNMADADTRELLLPLSDQDGWKRLNSELKGLGERVSAA